MPVRKSSRRRWSRYRNGHEGGVQPPSSFPFNAETVARTRLEDAKVSFESLRLICHQLQVEIDAAQRRWEEADRSYRILINGDRAREEAVKERAATRVAACTEVNSSGTDSAEGPRRICGAACADREHKRCDFSTGGSHRLQIGSVDAVRGSQMISHRSCRKVARNHTDGVSLGRGTDDFDRGGNSIGQMNGSVLLFALASFAFLLVALVDVDLRGGISASLLQRRKGTSAFRSRVKARINIPPENGGRRKPRAKLTGDTPLHNVDEEDKYNFLEAAEFRIGTENMEESSIGLQATSDDLFAVTPNDGGILGKEFSSTLTSQTDFNDVVVNDLTGTDNGSIGAEKYGNVNGRDANSEDMHLIHNYTAYEYDGADWNKIHPSNHAHRWKRPLRVVEDDDKARIRTVVADRRKFREEPTMFPLRPGDDTLRALRLLQEEEADYYDYYYDEPLVTCANNTVKMTITMIVGMASDDALKWSVYDHATGEVIYERTDGNITANEADMQYFMMDFCIHTTKCYTVTMSGIFYGFYNVALDDGSVLEGVSEEWKQINAAGYVRVGSGCESLCAKYEPLLSPVNEIIPDRFDARAHEIITVLTSVSGSEVFADVTSPQYRAACWIIHDDLRQVSATTSKTRTTRNTGEDDNYDSLVQRYVLATFFYAIRGDLWTINHGILGPEDVCVWGHDGTPSGETVENPPVGVRCDADTGRVTKINFKTAVEFSDDEVVLGGNIVSEIMKLNHLEEVVLTSNKLFGTIPENIGHELSRLSVLDLSDNALSGTLPLSLSKALSMKHLDFEGNKFSGTIPEDLFDLVLLEELDLSTNSLNGTISTRIGQLTMLVKCFLDKNSLNGTLPSEVGTASRLMLFTLPENKITGTIPAELMDIPLLHSMDLSDNSIGGTIPPEIAKLAHLKELVLSNNLLSGKIPETIGNLSSLTTLSLFDNPGLGGEVPSSLGKLTSLVQLRLHNSTLTGDVPDELCNGTALDLSSADCDGRISSPKVNCGCCKRCYGEFSKKERTGACPDNEVRIEVNFTGGFITDWEGVWWELKEESTQAVLVEEGPYSWVIPDTKTFSACVSSTDCFTFHSDLGLWDDLDYKTLPGYIKIVSEDGTIIHDGTTGPGGTWERQTVSFGYSNSDTRKSFKIDQCDALLICGKDKPEPRGNRRRDVFDRLVKVSGFSRVTSPAKPHYKAACWMIDEDKRELDAKDNTLIQRYVLALFHFNYNVWGGGTENGQGAAAGAPPAIPHECDWPGIKCSEQRILTEIDLSERGLSGALLQEVGELPMLEVLRLSDNDLGSTIPVELANLWSIMELDLGNNHFHLTLPSNIGQLVTLKKLVLRSNKLEGTLPVEIFQLTQLVELDISDNLLRGDVATEIGTLLDLEHLDLSQNFFTGEIPPEVANDEKLKNLHLSSNQFEGSIPPNLFHISSLLQLGLYSNQLEGRIPDGLSNVRQLQELQLHDNELTGSISDELGMLSYLTKVTLSYNELKGSVPTSLEKLEKLEMLNLHGNLLTGEAPDVKGANDEFQYITDCGDPNYNDNPISCESCTVCCNSEEFCQVPDKRELTLKEQTAILMSGLFLLLLLSASIGMILVKTKTIALKSVSNSYAWHLCGEESVYSFLLTRSKLGLIIFGVTITIQVFIFKIFLAAANFGDDNNDWEYSVRCPENITTCEDENEVSWVGWAMFGVLFFVYLAPDLINGLRLVYKAAACLCWRCLVSGVVLVMITVLAVWTSTFYTKATAMTDSLLIMDAVVLLFINDMDERMFFVLDNMYPTFMEARMKEAEEYSMKLAARQRRYTFFAPPGASMENQNGHSSGITMTIPSAVDDDDFEGSECTGDHFHAEQNRTSVGVEDEANEDDLKNAS